MGQILSNPVIDKEHHQGNDKFTAFGLCSMQGWRMSMEDAHIVELNVWENNEDDKQTSTETDHLAMYGVLDGHGGSGVAKFCGAHLASILRQQLIESGKKQQKQTNKYNNKFLIECIKESFLVADERILTDQVLQNDHSGCTSSCVIISKETQTIICANSGDSRSILATEGVAKALSFDHKPSLINEKSRIIAADGFVEMDRVNGNLALSRAIGDFEFKSNDSLGPEEQVVTAIPDILTHKINYDKDDFIILACDGIWECLTSQECVDMVYRGIMTPGMSLNDISSRIIDICCAPTTEGSGIGCDNMTIIIVALLKDYSETEDEWMDRIRQTRFLKQENNENTAITTTLQTTKGHIPTFELMRKRIFNSFDFDNKNVFYITTKSDEDKLVNENKSHESGEDNEENEETQDESRGQERVTKAAGPQQPQNQQSFVINFETLKQLLEAGVHIGGIENLDTSGDNNNNNESSSSSGPNRGTSSDSTILDILSSLSEAAAGETAPFESDDEQEAREIREAKIEQKKQEQN